MPGKFDSPLSAETPTFDRPGGLHLKEQKHWDAGWLYRYTGTQTTAPISNNPNNQASDPVGYQAWDNGWNAANTNTAGERRGPATTGAPAFDPPV